MANMTGLLSNPMFNMGIGLLSQRGRPEGLSSGLLNAQKADYRQQIMDQMRHQQEQLASKQDARRQLASQLSASPVPGSGPLNANPQAAYAADPMQQAMLQNVATGAPGAFDQMVQRQLVPQAQKLTDDQREYMFAKNQGYQGSFQDWLLDQRRAGATTITNDLGKDFTGDLGKGMAESVITQYDKMSGVREGLDNINIQRDLLNAGMKTGILANFKVGLGKVLQEAGINYDQDEIANTEAYLSATAKETANIIKEFGAGTGLSDADREYAEKAAAGKITMTQPSLMRILDIRQRASTKILKRYNKKIAQIKGSPYGKNLPYELSIDIPEHVSKRGAQIPKPESTFEMSDDEYLKLKRQLLGQ